MAELRNARRNVLAALFALICILGLDSAVAEECDNSDGELLLELQEQGNSLDWDCSNPVCDWPGVKCAQNTYLTPNIEELDLTKRNLNGSLPASWSSGFTSLLRMKLADNSLTGTLPAEWAQGFDKLQIMYLGGNKLNGSLPDAWGGGFKSLKDLDLSHNYLSGPLPLNSWNNSPEVFPRLTDLDIERNCLNGSAPANNVWAVGKDNEVQMGENCFEGNDALCPEWCRPSSSSNTGLIVRLAVGITAAVLLALIAGGLLWRHHRQKQLRKKNNRTLAGFVASLPVQHSSIKAPLSTLEDKMPDIESAVPLGSNYDMSSSTTALTTPSFALKKKVNTPPMSSSYGERVPLNGSMGASIPTVKSNEGALVPPKRAPSSLSSSYGIAVPTLSQSQNPVAFDSDVYISPRSTLEATSDYSAPTPPMSSMYGDEQPPQTTGEVETGGAYNGQSAVSPRNGSPNLSLPREQPPMSSEYEDNVARPQPTTTATCNSSITTTAAVGSATPNVAPGMDEKTPVERATPPMSSAYEHTFLRPGSVNGQTSNHRTPPMSSVYEHTPHLPASMNDQNSNLGPPPMSSVYEHTSLLPTDVNGKTSNLRTPPMSSVYEHSQLPASVNDNKKNRSTPPLSSCYEHTPIGDAVPLDSVYDDSSNQDDFDVEENRAAQQTATQSPEEEKTWVIDAADVTMCITKAGNVISVGRGATSEVYKGVFKGRLVAIKVIEQSSKFTDPNSRRRIMREINILRQIDHPNMLNFHGTAFSDRHIMLIFDFMPNGDLFSALHSKPTAASQGGRCNDEFLWGKSGRSIAIGIAEAVKYLHSKRIVHCDIKGQNVLLDENNEPRLGDLGLSKFANKEFVSKCGAIGTLAYAAPEQLNESRISNKVDIYSVGVILWEIVTGEVPLREARRPPRVPEECSQQLADIISACLSDQPQDRPSAETLCDQLKSCH